MTATVVDHTARPDVWPRIPALFAGVWPEYNLHGDVMAGYWDRLHVVFGRYQLALVDTDPVTGAEDVLATARGLPVVWNGTLAGLGAGLDAAIEAGFAAHDAGRAATTLCALGIEVAPRHQGRGLARVMLRALTDVAARAGFGHVIVPVRPTHKDRYPLVPIDRYVAWTTDDGSPFDPWVRTHVRCGGVLGAPLPHSSLITGTVTDWQGWTGLVFPDSGDYVIPQGLATVRIDRAADRGVYWEPNVWVVHEARAADTPVTAGAAGGVR